MCGLLEHGQKPYDDVLSNGLACAECSAVVICSYQTFPGFVDVQTCCVGIGNVEGRPRQYQVKVSLVRPYVTASPEQGAVTW